MKEDDLFILVKSIDKHEKRFFKLYAKLHNQNKVPQYIYLFNIMDKMVEFDDKQIKLEFTKVLPGKNLSRLKQYLKYHIFVALNAYHKKGFNQLQENEDLNTARILKTKGLYRMAEKHLQKLRKKAISKEDFQLQIQVNTALISLKVNEDHLAHKAIKLIEQYYTENLLCIDKMKEEVQLRLITTKISKLYNSEEKLKKEFNNTIVKFLKKDLAPFKSKNLLSSKAKYIYHNLVYNVYFISGNKKMALKTIEKVKQIVKNPYFKYYPNRIATTYVNLLHNYIFNKKVKPFYSAIQEAQTLLNKHPALNATYQYWIYLRELEFCSLVLHEKPSIDKSKKILKYIKSRKNILPSDYKNYLLLALGRCYFITKDYENCQEQLLKITLEDNVSVNNSYFLEIYLMEILCYYELDAKKVAKQKWEALQRKISKSTVEYDELITSIDKIGQLIKLKEESIEVFQEINDLMKAGNKTVIFVEDFYFLLVWVKQKIDLLKA